MYEDFNDEQRTRPPDGNSDAGSLALENRSPGEDGEAQADNHGQTPPGGGDRFQDQYTRRNGGKKEVTFVEFHREFPQVYREFVLRAAMMVRNGRKRYSSNYIIEYIRWDTDLPDRNREADNYEELEKRFDEETGFDLPCVVSPYYSRMLLEQYFDKLPDNFFTYRYMWGEPERYGVYYEILGDDRYLTTELRQFLWLRRNARLEAGIRGVERSIDKLEKDKNNEGQLRDMYGVLDEAEKELDWEQEHKDLLIYGDPLVPPGAVKAKARR